MRRWQIAQLNHDRLISLSNDSAYIKAVALERLLINESACVYPELEFLADCSSEIRDDQIDDRCGRGHFEHFTKKALFLAAEVNGRSRDQVLA